MTACGTTWQPNELRQVIRTYPTSTRVVEVMTDNGPAFLKGMGNPQGNQALACELVGTELAYWFGLMVPEFALISVTDSDYLPLNDLGTRVDVGRAFVSKRVIDGINWDRGFVLLNKLRKPDDVAKLVVFDTWIMNFDRYPPDDSLATSSVNADNLLFSYAGNGKYNLIAFDHSHCFTEGDLWFDISDQDLIEDSRIFGFVPEFRSYITESGVAAAVERLRQIDKATAVEIVSSVPQEWDVTSSVINCWADLIYRRSRFVADTIFPKLIAQGSLGF